MTEPTSTPVELGPPPALVDGNGMPDAVAADVNVAAAEGMEVKTRSQWSYARRRFFRHRVAIIAAFYWTPIARIVRGVFLSLREKEYVEAAKAVGAGDLRIMFRHILPNTLGPIIVNGTLAVADAIILEAFLSFLGFGIADPTPSLGKLVNGGQSYPQDWWLTVLPGLVLVMIVICVNFVGDGLRDALDPQQRRVRA